MSAFNVRPVASHHFNRRRARDPRGQTSPCRDPRQSYEHYLALAKDRTLAGDQIEAERYYQYAEHYLRSMGSSAA
ncbi:uncharacterized protein DUF4167 [Bosea sp. BK604]|nr:uncharacterized protein DUF4167 [Bosea sp. BK604]